MRMLRPSPGEAADRQTILLLKCKYGDLKHLNLKPWQDEMNELQTYLEVHWFKKIADEQGQRYTALQLMLKEVNSQLWKIEDEVRLRAKQTPLDKERLVEIALLVPKLNDDRADLVKQINQVFQVSEIEKVYIAS